MHCLSENSKIIWLFFAFLETKKGYRQWQVRQEVQRIQVLMAAVSTFLIVHTL